ncbi:MAG: CDP-alcohol phosphatidyltransferase family protein [Acidobacteria bacterium]|nr:CDP-alcohol phosphatidyltransferase family protein [Acidobacteriota bacterium]
MNLNIPNLLTLLRMGVVPLFVIALLNGEVGKALVLFAVAGLTDALDGFAARVFKQTSVLGAYLDPIADKLLITSAYIMLSLPSSNPELVRIPIWVTVLVLARDILILVIVVVLWMALDQPKFTPSTISKVNTVAQVTAVILVMLSGLHDGMIMPAMVCIYAVAALTVLSGIDYFYRLNQMVARSDSGAQA